MDKLKNTKILGAVGLGLMFVATFLPYAVTKYIAISVSLFGYWEGKITLLVCFVNLLFVFKNYVKQYVPQLFENGIAKSIENAKPIYSLIPTGISALLNIRLISQVMSYSYITFGIGFYLMILGILCMVGYAILYKEPEQSTITNNVTVSNTSAPFSSPSTPGVEATQTPTTSAPSPESVPPTVQSVISASPADAIVDSSTTTQEVSTSVEPQISQVQNTIPPVVETNPVPNSEINPSDQNTNV